MSPVRAVRRPVTVLALFALLLLVVGAPLAEWVKLHRQSTAYACADHACGCTAESCLISCCCFPNRESNKNGGHGLGSTPELDIAEALTCTGGPELTVPSSLDPQLPPADGCPLSEPRRGLGCRQEPSSVLAMGWPPPTPPPRSFSRA